MSFNKIKFNRQRFNRSSDITVYIQGFIDGYGKISTKGIRVTDGQTNIEASSIIIAKVIKDIPIKALLQAKGDITPESLKIINLDTLIDSQGDVNSKATVIINISGEFVGEGNIDSYLRKIAFILAELTGEVNLEGSGEIIIEVDGLFDGASDIKADTYIIYKLSYIILPTRALIRDTKTKAILVD